MRQLQYVIAVAREQNFTRAAARLNIAQPSLSQQIAKLEEEIGLPLFERNRNHVSLTYAGTIFLEKAQKISDLVEQLRTEMDDVTQLKKGRLVVGSLPMTGSHVMPVILPAFRHRHPEIEVVFIEDSTANLEKRTAAGETDLSILSLPMTNDQLTCTPLLDEAIVLAVPLHHRLANYSSPIPLHEVANESFIVLKRGQGFRKITFDLCAQAGFEPHIVFESNNIETIQSLVASGIGVALVPHMVMREPGSRHAPAYLPLLEPPATRSLVIAYRKHRYLSNAAQAFIATVQDVMKAKPEF